MLVCLMWLLYGCDKASARVAPSREFTADFEVQPSQDGQSIVWSLQFKSRQQYHAFLETTADGCASRLRDIVAENPMLFAANPF